MRVWRRFHVSEYFLFDGVLCDDSVFGQRQKIIEISGTGILEVDLSECYGYVSAAAPNTY